MKSNLGITVMLLIRNALRSTGSITTPKENTITELEEFRKHKGEAPSSLQHIHQPRLLNVN